MKKNTHAISTKKILEQYKKRLDALNEDGREKLNAYIYIILSLAALSFFGIFAIRPTLSTISTLNQQYRENQNIHNQLVQKSNALRSLDVQYQQLTPDLPIVLSAVPKSTRMAYVTRQIETLAANNGLALTQLSFGTIELYPALKDNPALYSFTFTAALEGNEDQVQNFISQVISFDRLVNIDQLSTGNREDGAYGVTLTGRVFFSKK